MAGQVAETRHFLWGTAGSILTVGAFVVWAQTSPASLETWSVEDGLIEWVTALLFGLSGVGFLVAMMRSRFLRERKGRSQYAMTLLWALLMFVFWAEEISWGQRVVGFGTPDSMRVINKQKEFNIHNIVVVDAFLGGSYRYLSLMMLTTGLVLPIAASTAPGRRIIQRTAFPVVQRGYMGFFIGSYLFGKHYDPILFNTAAEVRELLMAVGMCLFAGHGALQPWTLFRLDRPGRA